MNINYTKSYLESNKKKIKNKIFRALYKDVNHLKNYLVLNGYNLIIQKITEFLLDFLSVYKLVVIGSIIIN